MCNIARLDFFFPGVGVAFCLVVGVRVGRLWSGSGEVLPRQLREINPKPKAKFPVASPFPFFGSNDACDILPLEPEKNKIKGGFARQNNNNNNNNHGSRHRRQYSSSDKMADDFIKRFFKMPRFNEEKLQYFIFLFFLLVKIVILTAQASGCACFN